MVTEGVPPNVVLGPLPSRYRNVTVTYTQGLKDIRRASPARHVEHPCHVRRTYLGHFSDIPPQPRVEPRRDPSGGPEVICTSRRSDDALGPSCACLRGKTTKYGDRGEPSPRVRPAFVPRTYSFRTVYVWGTYGVRHPRIGYRYPIQTLSVPYASLAKGQEKRVKCGGYNSQNTSALRHLFCGRYSRPARRRGGA